MCSSDLRHPGLSLISLLCSHVMEPCPLSLIKEPLNVPAERSLSELSPLWFSLEPPQEEADEESTREGPVSPRRPLLQEVWGFPFSLKQELW